MSNWTFWTLAVSLGLNILLLYSVSQLLDRNYNLQDDNRAMRSKVSAYERLIPRITEEKNNA